MCHSFGDWGRSGIKFVVAHKMVCITDPYTSKSANTLYKYVWAVFLSSIHVTVQICLLPLQFIYWFVLQNNSFKKTVCLDYLLRRCFFEWGRYSFASHHHSCKKVAELDGGCVREEFFTLDNGETWIAYVARFRRQ